MGSILRIFLLIFTLKFANCGLVRSYYNVTDLEYDTMPTLFHLDNYDNCMNKIGTLYCYATIQLSPLDDENPSRTWEIIQEVLSVNRTYRHDRIRHGICLPATCPKINPKFYTTGNGSQELWEEVSACYSDIYKMQGLKGDVTKMHCENDQPFFDKIDLVDVLVAGIILILIFVNLTCSIYESYASYQSDELYERMTQSTTFRQVVTSFSLRKNWHRLRAPHGSEDAECLAPIQGIRVYNSYLVIMCHTAMSVLYGPIFNPRYTEDYTLKPESAFLTNGSLMCQTFFVTTGWMFSYTLCSYAENKERIRMKDWILAFINRYLRLIPTLLLPVGLTATWLRFLSRGPVWQHYVGDEHRYCRENWWATLLFVNNYYKPEEMCVQQTWYLSVDSQLFVFGAIVMSLIFKNPKSVLKIFSAFVTLGIGLTFLHNYYHNFDIIYRSTPEALYTLYKEHKMWLTTFVAPESALASYVVGLACGYYLHKFRRENRKFITNKISLLLWYIFIWVVPVTTIVIASKFYADGFTFTRTQAATYQAFSRFLFGFPLAILMFGFATGAEKVMSSTAVWAPLQVLARLSYSVFLVHLIPMRVKYGSIRTPVYVTDSFIFFNSLSDFVVGYALGAVACLMLEMPMSSLQKMLFSSKGKTKLKEKNL